MNLRVIWFLIAINAIKGSIVIKPLSLLLKKPLDTPKHLVRCSPFPNQQNIPLVLKKWNGRFIVPSNDRLKTSSKSTNWRAIISKQQGEEEKEQVVVLGLFDTYSFIGAFRNDGFKPGMVKRLAYAQHFEPFCRGKYVFLRVFKTNKFLRVTRFSSRKTGFQVKLGTPIQDHIRPLIVYNPPVYESYNAVSEMDSEEEFVSSVLGRSSTLLLH